MGHNPAWRKLIHFVVTTTRNRMGHLVLLLLATTYISAAWTKPSNASNTDYPVEECAKECGPGGMCFKSTPGFVRKKQRSWKTHKYRIHFDYDYYSNEEEMEEEWLRMYRRKYKHEFKEIPNERFCKSCGDGFRLTWRHKCQELFPCDELCGPGQMCTKSENYPGDLACVSCAEGWGRSYRNSREQCIKLETCDAECGVGGTCFKDDFNLECQSCGEGLKFLHRPYMGGLALGGNLCLENNCNMCYGGECYTRHKTGTKHCHSCGDGYFLWWGDGRFLNQKVCHKEEDPKKGATVGEKRRRRRFWQ